MGSIDNGFLDGFTGRLGNVVGYRWRGRMCVRSMPSQYRDARTPDQVQQRALFTQIVRIASRARRVLKVGMKVASIDAQMTESNYFMRINKRCFSLQAPSQRRADSFPSCTAGEVSADQVVLSVDYENLVLADGPVAPVAFCTVRLLDETTISVDFEKNPLHRVAHPDDLVYVAAYCPELGDFDLSAPVYRRSKSLTMSLNEFWCGREIQLWGFVVDGAGRASRSQYLGVLLLSEESVSADVSGKGSEDLYPFENRSFSADIVDDEHLRETVGRVVGFSDYDELRTDAFFGDDVLGGG